MLQGLWTKKDPIPPLTDPTYRVSSVAVAGTRMSVQEAATPPPSLQVSMRILLSPSSLSSSPETNLDTGGDDVRATRAHHDSFNSSYRDHSSSSEGGTTENICPKSTVETPTAEQQRLIGRRDSCTFDQKERHQPNLKRAKQSDTRQKSESGTCSSDADYHKNDKKNNSVSNGTNDPQEQATNEIHKMIAELEHERDCMYMISIHNNILLNSLAMNVGAFAE